MRQRLPRLAAVVLAATAVVAAVSVWWSGRRDSNAPPASALEAGASAVNQAVPAAAPRSAFESLTGAWRRPDGGYVLEIRSVAPDGRMDAAYFNPWPINVARADASRDGASISLFLELRDVNYPGSTYTLTYDPASDRLTGAYFQAALQEQYEVFFERLR